MCTAAGFPDSQMLDEWQQKKLLSWTRVTPELNALCFYDLSLFLVGSIHSFWAVDVWGNPTNLVRVVSEPSEFYPHPKFAGRSGSPIPSFSTVPTRSPSTTLVFAPLPKRHIHTKLYPLCIDRESSRWEKHGTVELALKKVIISSSKHYDQLSLNNA